MKLLIILIVILAIIAIAQLTKVYELSRALRHTDDENYETADNKMQANLFLVWMVVFFGLVIYQYVKYGDFLPDSASKHGEDIDFLMDINLWTLTVMFFIMNALLFLAAWKYQYKKGRKVAFMPHDYRLELLWTMIPGASLSFFVVFGLITWNKMMAPASEDALQVEVYSKQFDWTARYPGTDKSFGYSNINLITTDNPLGMVTSGNIADRLLNLDEEIAVLQVQLDENAEAPILPKSHLEAIQDKIYKLSRHKQRLMDLKETKLTSGVSDWEAGLDDKIIKGELHVPIGQEVEFIFRSQDVIHSAYMPHFRIQMNTLPGQPTRFKMTPTITTKEMREKMGNEEFDYVLLCNKVCGSAHFNMQMKVVVETEEEYSSWMRTLKTYGRSLKSTASIEQSENSDSPVQSNGI